VRHPPYSALSASNRGNRFGIPFALRPNMSHHNTPSPARHLSAHIALASASTMAMKAVRVSTTDHTIPSMADPKLVARMRNVRAILNSTVAGLKVRA